MKQKSQNISRIEIDSMGEIEVSNHVYWAAQTERSRKNFQIGVGLETMPMEIIQAFAMLKMAAAKVNHHLNSKQMTKEKMNAIIKSCKRILNHELDEHFPLVVWQTGSGTHTNMNVNEVIMMVNQGVKLHPNDDVNMSQSSNDTFPTAMSIAGVLKIENQLIPSLEGLITTFKILEEENRGVLKCGRTHLQDAIPMYFSQEISAWRSSLEFSLEQLKQNLDVLRSLALGATAIGTGLNAPLGFDHFVSLEISKIAGTHFVPAKNKFHALSSKAEFVMIHGILKTLASDLMKIANDIRWLASGPRNGLHELDLPANEPGSSIMPGKVNPTQCEQVMMVATQVMGNDTTIDIASSQGNFELNVFMPVIAYNFLQSVRLLSDSILSFNKHCVQGIKANRKRMEENVTVSLMIGTALNPIIGYEKVAKVVQKAYQENISLKQSCIELGYLDAETFERFVQIEQMAQGGK